MTKYIVRLETDRITWKKVRKPLRQYLSWDARFYDNADWTYIKDCHSSDAIRVTPIDSNQVGKVNPKLIDPDDIRCGIASMEISGTKKKSWLNFDASKLWLYLIGFIIAGTIIYTVLSGGVF